MHERIQKNRSDDVLQKIKENYKLSVETVNKLIKDEVEDVDIDDENYDDNYDINVEFR